MAAALAGLTRETGDLKEGWADRFERVLTKSSFGIGEALAQIPAVRESRASRVLLLVDQFEELFRFATLRSEGSLDSATAAERRDEATAFVRLLLTATQSLQLPIHVVVTMRSDFIGDCARFHGLPEAVSRSQFLVPGMTRDQREDVIRKPLAEDRARGRIDAVLVQRALNDTNEDPGSTANPATHDDEVLGTCIPSCQAGNGLPPASDHRRLHGGRRCEACIVPSRE
jgi:hypothetical protein